TYDDRGRRTSMTTLEGRWAYEYDVLGQLTKVTLPGGRTIEYHYDAVGNRISVIDDGITTNYTTNNLNQYTAVGTTNDIYDPDGNLVLTRNGDQASSYTYNDESRLVRAVTPEGTFTYEYDPFGNRIAATRNGQRTEYLLDPAGLGNLVAEYT